MDVGPERALLVKPLKLLTGDENPLTSDKGRVAKETEGKVGDAIGQGAVRVRRQHRAAANVHQVDGSHIHPRRDLYKFKSGIY